MTIKPIRTCWYDYTAAETIIQVQGIVNLETFWNITKSVNS